MTTNNSILTQPTATTIAADTIMGSARPDGPLHTVLTRYADQLTAADAFADLAPTDARTVASLICWDARHGDEGRGMRHRAAVITAGHWDCWDNPTGVARAFTIAATVLDAL